MSVKPPNLTSIGIVKDLAAALNASEANSKFAGLPKGSLRGTVVDVNDPEERGRVKVVFDDMNPSVPQVTGAGEWSEERKGEKPDASHWIDTSPAFKGRQPPGLVGKRVNINASNGQYQYAILQDVLHDPELLATDAKDKPEMPNNSSMTRLPCYPSGSLPPASAENVGCVIVETGGFDGMDWLTVCLNRGGYKWVNLMDRLHIHDSQAADSDGDSEGTVNDDTHATT
jgi:hypothetical protein